MKSRLQRVLLLLAAVVACSVAAVPARAQSAEAPLTNNSVVKLVRAGFKEKTVIAIIRSRPARFELSPERLIELKKSGVSERIILAMLAREEATMLASEDWEDDDGFFDEGGGVAKSPKPGGEQGGGVDIFGSSGGARGRTRSRGGSGGGESDTQTLGSASVKIIRPPAEAGGAGGAAKLERTPTLNNNKVVELVEAGFSEGTIIRRIEQSPVEFDLSPAKLSELRKRRVTEPVIAAMRAAMGEDGEQPARPDER
ncbi:MAG TPA: hypothetical protein VFS10_04855 [Pyrinomonadaceae bacterium]|nr:hypothetical protein [Pyrinomonadaceae bacterium]